MPPAMRCLHMVLSDLTGGKLQDYKLPLLGGLIAVSLLLELYVHWYLGITTVYSHFFYIPVVLGAVWYGKRGVLVAILLGAVLLSVTFLKTGAIDDDSIIRTLMFCIVGLVIGAVSDYMRGEQERMMNEVTDAAIQSGLRGRTGTGSISEVRSRIASFAGVKRLREQGDIPGLIRALRNRDPAVQYDAIEALGELADPAAIDALILALTGDKYSGIRWKAAEALGKIGEPAVPSLIAALTHPDEGVRWKAAITLGEIGDQRGIIPLIGLLSDTDRFVRSRAAYALGLAGSPAIPSLSETLEDAPSEVRTGIVTALGKMHEPAAISVLIRALTDSSEDVRQDIISLLASQGEEAFDLLVAALADPEPLRQQGAAMALAAMGRPEALEPLQKALESAGSPTREVLSSAIGEIRSRQAPERSQNSPE
jgi:HEAT repeat protein